MLIISACTQPARPKPPPQFGDVVILIIDNFATTEATAAPSAGSNCAFTDFENEVGAGGGGGGLPEGTAHGEAVFNVVNSQLQAIPGTDRRSSQPRNSEWQYLGHTITVKALNIENFETRSIADKIDAEVKSGRYVLNMSFVVFPCEVTDWLLGTDGGRMADADIFTEYQRIISEIQYLAAFKDLLSGLSASAGLDAIRKHPSYRQLQMRLYYSLVAGRAFDGRSGKRTAAINLLMEDPLAVKVGEKADLRLAISVAAAGNGIYYLDPSPASSPSVQHVSLPFPFAPALWPSVVSASASIATTASDTTTGQRAAYSNPGEVAMPGLYDLPGNRSAIGTSFAAPRLSAWQAIYFLFYGSVICMKNLPALNYVDQPPPGFNDNVWKDLSLRAAASQHCPHFTDFTIPPPSQSP